MPLIRVLQVTGIMDRGGAETMIMNLYRHVDREKIQFDFVENSLAPGAFDEEILEMGGRIYYCPHYTGKNHLAYCKWWKDFWRIYANDYPIAHGHIGSTAAIYLSEAKKKGVYTVAHSHGADSSDFYERIRYKLFSYPTRWIADSFLACSAQAGLDRYGPAVVSDRKRYAIMNNAIDTAVFSFNQITREKIRRELGISDDTRLIGHVGRFVDLKNHAFLLKVFAELHKYEPHSNLLLIGDGPLRSSLEREAESLGIDARVLFLGLQQDVSSFLQAMDIMVFPSKNEGLPLTLVEAQTSGLPCVISDSIPKDCILCKDLISAMSLNESPAAWAEHVLARIGEPRRDHSREVASAGFDIRETAKWLEDFYLEHARR